MIDPFVLAGLLADGRFRLTSEALCQADIEAHLRGVLPPECVVSREHRLSAYDRPDFLVDGRYVVECKIQRAGKAAAYRQLKRYAAYPQVEALILCTNTAMGLPPVIEGKPAFLVSLGRAWL